MDVWTNGRVDNEKDFLSSFKQRMMERFKQERNAKLFDSDKIFYLRLIQIRSSAGNLSQHHNNQKV